MAAEHHVLFYDGVCGLCDRLVHFVIARDPTRAFRFAPLQGHTAAAELSTRGYDAQALDTVYVVTKDGRVLLKSRAIFFILSQLGGAWRVLSALRILPRFLTDLGYDLIASIRYRIWGRMDACPAPPPETRALFLE